MIRCCLILAGEESMASIILILLASWLGLNVAFFGMRLYVSAFARDREDGHAEARQAKAGSI